MICKKQPLPWALLIALSALHGDFLTSNEAASNRMRTTKAINNHTCYNHTAKNHTRQPCYNHKTPYHNHATAILQPKNNHTTTILQPYYTYRISSLVKHKSRPKTRPMRPYGLSLLQRRSATTPAPPKALLGHVGLLY